MTVSEDLIEYRKQLAQVYCMSLKGIGPSLSMAWNKTSALENLERAMKALDGFWEDEASGTFGNRLTDDELVEYFE